VKILVVSSYPPRRCGIGAYARDQVAQLRADGHAVTVLSPPDGSGEVTVPFLRGRPFFRAARLARGFDRVIVHFQPGLYYRRGAPAGKVLASFGLLWLAMRAGSRLEILVHEADPPNLWRPDYALLRLAFVRAGTVSFHTEAERRDLEHRYRVGVRAALVPHRVQARATPAREARARLGLADAAGTVFVCPGFIQPSKGLDRAVDAFAASALDGARLYIVGSVRDPTPELETYARRLEERCRAVAGVTMVERFLDDEEFDLWVSAADWVVLPYRRSWSSGVLARAHALGRPAIAAAVGGLVEQVVPGDVLVRDDSELAKAMSDAVGMVAPSLSGDSGTASAGQEGLGASSSEAVGPAQGLGASSSEAVGPAQGLGASSSEAVGPQRGGRGMLLGFILVSVVLAALAQLTLKHGMDQVTHGRQLPLDLAQPLETLRRVGTNVFVWLGLATFVVSAAVWLVVLSRASLSFAYPFVSLTYVLILLFDRLVLHQPISGVRYGGVALIIGGILLISRTHSLA
jgi:glycosyltransferase involved in cell wall biosynthesis/multidrug transporter EmrE-like cation transporter